MDKRIAILATDGFEESELKSPKEAMEKEGFTVDIVSENLGSIKAWSDGNWSNNYQVIMHWFYQVVLLIQIS